MLKNKIKMYAHDFDVEYCILYVFDICFGIVV